MARFELPHLARRFFQVLKPRPLTPAEQAAVSRHLRPGSERGLFWGQSPADQRHAYETMRRAALTTTDEVVLRAALLHDVGKGTVRIGAFSRSIATIADVLGAPMTTRMRSYRSHGPAGAALLEAAGAEPLVVDFAARHPSDDPADSDPLQWRVLLAADDV